MKITLHLLKHSHRFLFKTLWEMSKAKYVLTPLRKPKALEIDGTEIIPAAQLLKYNILPKPINIDKENKFEEIVYEVKKSTSLLEGELQAFYLTNSQPFYQMPSCVKPMISTVEDEYLQEIIFQANRYDATMDKLPRRTDPNLPIWRYKAECGIPNNKITLITLKNLLRICETEALEQNFNLNGRRTIYNVPISSEFQYKEKEILLNDTQDFLIYSNALLDDFGDHKLIDDTIHYSHKSIYPLAPTIDIPPLPRNDTTLASKSRKKYDQFNPQTSIICYNDSRITSELRAVALLFCFGNALDVAHNLYGEDVVKLLKPISTQCIFTNGINFHFTFFQLNTLNLFGDIKNLVWFDSDNYFFQKILPKRSMLRNTKYQNYDRLVFDKLFSVFCHGLSKNES